MLPATKATSTSTQHCISLVSSASTSTSSPSTSTMPNVKQQQQTIATAGQQLTTVVQAMSMKPTLVAASNKTNVLLNPSNVPTVTPPQQAAVIAKNNGNKNEIRYLPIATMPTKQNTRNATIIPINQQNKQNPSSTFNFNFNNNKIMKNGHGQPQGTLAVATTNPSTRIQLLPAKTVNPKAITIPTLTIIAPNNPVASSAIRMPSLINSSGNILNGGQPINSGGGGGGVQTTVIRNAATVPNPALIAIDGAGVPTAATNVTSVTSSKVAAAAIATAAPLSSYKVALNTTKSSSVISLHNKQQTAGLANTTTNTNISINTTTIPPQRSASGGITITKSSTSSTSPSANTTLLAFSNGKTITTSSIGGGVGVGGNSSSATAIALSNGLKQRPRISGNNLLSKDAISQLVKYGQVNAGGAKTFMNVSGNGSVGAPPLARITKTLTTQNSFQQPAVPQQKQQQQQRQHQQQQQQQKQKQKQKVAKSNQQYQEQQQKQNQQQQEKIHQQQQQQQLLIQEQLLIQQQHEEQVNQKQQKHKQLLEQQKQNQQTQQQQKQLKLSSQHQQQQQQQKHKDINVTTNNTVTSTPTSKPLKTYVVKHNSTNKQRTAATVTSIQSGCGSGSGSGAGGGQQNITMPVAVLDSQNKIRTISIPTDANLFLDRKSPLGIITTSVSASTTATSTTTTTTTTTGGGGGGASVGAKLLPLNKSILLAAINAPKLQKSSMAVATTEASATASTQPPKAQTIVIEMPHNQEKQQENNKQQYQQPQQQQAQKQQPQQQQPQKQQQIVKETTSKQDRSKSLTGNANDQEESITRRHSVAIMAKDNITINNIPTSTTTTTTTTTSKAKRKSIIFNENETIIETITINDDDDDDDDDDVIVDNGNLVNHNNNNNNHYFDIDDNFEDSSTANSAATSSHVASDFEDNIDYLVEVNNIIRAREQHRQQSEQVAAPPAKISRNEITEKIINVTKSKLQNLSKKQNLTKSQTHLEKIINNININDSAILQIPFLELQKSLMLQNRNVKVDNHTTTNPITSHATAAPIVPAPAAAAAATPNASSLLLPTNQRIKPASFSRICNEVTISSLPSSSSSNTTPLIASNSTTSLLDTTPNLMFYKTKAESLDDPGDDVAANIDHLMMMLKEGRGAEGVSSVGSGINEVKQTSSSLMLKMLSTFRMLKWHDRVGLLDDSNLRFELNEFNLVQIRERCEKRLGPADYFEKPLFERPNRQMDTTVDPLLYLCKRCNYHGPALEFLAPKFCSITCLRRNSIKRKSSTNLNNDRNDQHKHRRLVQNNDDSLLKKSFRWSDYLEDKLNGYAAPIHLFFNPFPIGPNVFERGMKLEAIDPENCSLFCVCTVADIRGYRLKLSFDGYSSTYDFWINADSMDIFPPGWCEKTKRVLQPPKGYDAAANDDAMPFDWNTYLIRNKARPAPWNLFTHLHSMAMPVTNPFKIGMHLEAEDLNDTGKICVATVADILDERIRVHFDGWDDCYDFWVHISSPYIHPCGWHEGRQQLIVPPDYNHSVFKWPKYIKHVGGIEADPEFFAAREPMDFKSDMKLEVVDQRNPCLIRPATVITRKGYRIQLHLDCWPSEYFFWLEDDSPDLHPIGWCEATAHELEAPPGFKSRPPQMPCDVNGCRGFGNAKRFHLNVHALRDCCPYAPENWRTKIVKPTRVKPHEILYPQLQLRPPTKETNNEVIQKNTSPPSPSPSPSLTTQVRPATTTTSSPKSKKQQHKQSILKYKPESIVTMDLDDDDDEDDEPILIQPIDIKMETDDDHHMPSSPSSLKSLSLSVSASASNPIDISSHLSVLLSTPSTSVEPALVSKQENDVNDDDNDNANNDDVKKSDEFTKLVTNLVADYGARCARNYKLLLKNSEEYKIDNIKSNPIHWTNWDVFEYVERAMSTESVAHVLFEEDFDGRGFLQLSQDDLIDHLDIKMGPASKLFSIIMHLRIAVATKFHTIESGVELDPPPATTDTTVNNEPNDDLPSTSSASASASTSTSTSSSRASLSSSSSTTSSSHHQSQ